MAGTNWALWKTLLKHEGKSEQLKQIEEYCGDEMKEKKEVWEDEEVQYASYADYEFGKEGCEDEDAFCMEVKENLWVVHFVSDLWQHSYSVAKSCREDFSTNELLSAQTVAIKQEFVQHLQKTEGKSLDPNDNPYLCKALERATYLFSVLFPDDFQFISRFVERISPEHWKEIVAYCKENMDKAERVWIDRRKKCERVERAKKDLERCVGYYEEAQHDLWVANYMACLWQYNFFMATDCSEDSLTNGQLSAQSLETKKERTQLFREVDDMALTPEWEPSLCKALDDSTELSKLFFPYERSSMKWY
jgi:hypothetical protein